MRNSVFLSSVCRYVPLVLLFISLTCFTHLGEILSALEDKQREDEEIHNILINLIETFDVGEHNATRVAKARIKNILKRNDKLIHLVANVYKKHKNALIKKNIIDVLGSLNNKEAVGNLVELYGSEKSPFLKRHIAINLSKNHRILKKAFKAVLEKKLLPDNLFYNFFIQYQVEEYLMNEITPDDSFGNYPGQFDKLAELGKDNPKVKDVLKSIITNPAHPFIYEEVTLQRVRIMRNLALEALGYFKDKELIKFIQKLVNYRIEMNTIDVYDLTDVAVRALHSLGDEEPIKTMLNIFSVKEMAAFWANDIISYFDIRLRKANLLTKMKRYKEAENIYLSVVSIVLDPTVCYNLACLYAIQGKKEEALKYFTRAVEGGYDDLYWLEKDKELDNIRGLPEFKKLIEKIKAEKSQE